MDAQSAPVDGAGYFDEVVDEVVLDVVVVLLEDDVLEDDVLDDESLLEEVLLLDSLGMLEDEPLRESLR